MLATGMLLAPDRVAPVPAPFGTFVRVTYAHSINALGVVDVIAGVLVGYTRKPLTLEDPTCPQYGIEGVLTASDWLTDVEDYVLGDPLPRGVNRAVVSFDHHNPNKLTVQVGRRP